jgi:hypothetical protein
MSDDFMWMQFNIKEFRNRDTEKYSAWVYMDGTLPQVYEDEQPNTEEVWIKFYKFNHFYWSLLENECIDETKGGSFYNYNKLKQFMLERMICSTNLEDVLIEYGKDGRLTKESFNSVMSIHPRILRVVMNKVDVLPKPMDKDEERELEKQCSKLFGRGEGVINPHQYITMYCNLVAFWEKFGMNYFDILKLPQDVFSALKKVMSLENTNKSERMDEIAKESKAQSKPAKRGHSVSF